MNAVIFSYSVNALTLLIVILALADSSQQMIETRLSAIFDLFDFAGTSQISRDEAVGSHFALTF